MDVPEVRLTWSGVHLEACGVCEREWPMQAIPVPSYYTVASIETGNVPVPVCDHCIEQHSAEMFEALLADRRRFYAE